MTKAGQKIIEGAREAVAWTKATNGGRDLPTEADRVFLRRLSMDTPLIWDDPKGAGVRENCSWYGWARPSLDGWLLTESGRVVLETRIHERPHPAEPALPSHDGEVSYD